MFFSFVALMGLLFYMQDCTFTQKEIKVIIVLFSLAVIWSLWDICGHLRNILKELEKKNSKD